MKSTTFSKDLENNKIFIAREFDAPVTDVWRTWTEPELLDQWWAPKPWRARTRSMEFREGGAWFYDMLGPDGEVSNCRADYHEIKKEKSFTGIDAFCDEKGNISSSFPVMHWKTTFTAIATGTRVDVEITFESREDLEKIVQMGFQEGFAAAHQNLDELLRKEFAL